MANKVRRCWYHGPFWSGVSIPDYKNSTQGRQVGHWLRTPSQQCQLYMHVYGRNTIHLVTSQSLFTVPDVSQSLFGKKRKKDRYWMFYAPVFGENSAERTWKAEICRLEALAVGKAKYARPTPGLKRGNLWLPWAPTTGALHFCIISASAVPRCGPKRPIKRFPFKESGVAPVQRSASPVACPTPREVQQSPDRPIKRCPTSSAVCLACWRSQRRSVWSQEAVTTVWASSHCTADTASRWPSRVNTGTCTHGTITHGTITHGTITHGTRTHMVQSHTVQSHTVHTHMVQSHTVHTHTHGTHTHTIQSHTVQSHTVQSHTVQSHTVHTHTRYNHTRYNHTHSTHTHGTHTHTVKSHTVHTRYTHRCTHGTIAHGTHTHTVQSHTVHTHTIHTHSDTHAHTHHTHGANTHGTITHTHTVQSHTVHTHTRCNHTQYTHGAITHGTHTHTVHTQWHTCTHTHHTQISINQHSHCIAGLASPCQCSIIIMCTLNDFVYKE